MDTIKVHPAAALFPMLPDDELKALADDIKRNGLLHALVKDADGRLLDGRNRLAACAIAGVEPMFITYDAGDPFEYVISANVNRRHLTAGQRAFVASELANLRNGSNQFRTEKQGSSTELPTDAPSMTKAEAAKAVGSTEGAISKARVIEKETPELVRDVKSGKETLDGAYNKAVEARAAKTRPLPNTTEELVQQRKGATPQPAATNDAGSRWIAFEKMLDHRDFDNTHGYGRFRRPTQADADEFAASLGRRREIYINLMAELRHQIRETALTDAKKLRETAFADAEKLRAELNERERHLEVREAHQRKRDADVSRYMTKDDFKLVLGCLHSDRATTVCTKCGERNVDERLIKRLDKSFGIVNRLEVWVNENPIAVRRERGWEPPKKPKPQQTPPPTSADRRKCAACDGEGGSCHHCNGRGTVSA